MATSVGSGLGSYLSSVIETTYGAWLTPTKSVEYGSHTVEWKPKRVTGMGLANGSQVQKAAQRVTTTSTVVGDVKMQGFYKGMGQWLGALLGSLGVAPVQQGGTTAYLQTHALAGNYGQSLSLQAGIPQLTGTIVPRNWAGVKVPKGVFACAVDGILDCTFSVDGRSEDTAAGRVDTAAYSVGAGSLVTDTSITAHDVGAPVTGTNIPANSYVWNVIPGVSFNLSSSPTQYTSVAATGTGTSVTVGGAYAAPSYAAGNNVYSFSNANFQIGAYGSEVTVEGIRNVTLTIERPMKVDNFYQDGSGNSVNGTLKQQPVQNGFTKISIEIESDYISDPAFVGQFVSDTAQSVIWTFNSTSNAGTAYPYYLKFAVPDIQWDAGPPSVSGPEIVQPKLSLVGLYDGTHTAATITYMSTDTTL